jgi:predicted AlkP superfamily phosphohydrolase/phosphomutase
MERPKKNEYAPAYQKYIDLVDTGDFIELLDKNTESTISFFSSIDKKKENYKYAVNKWTIKEVLMHIIDNERGFSYRAIVCVRNDNKTPLYGMDENFYAENVDVTEISMNSLIEEFIAVRRAFKFIYTNSKMEKFSFLGNAIDHKISARAIGYISIGHISHHCSVIKAKYLS